MHSSLHWTPDTKLLFPVLGFVAFWIDLFLSCFWPVCCCVAGKPQFHLPSIKLFLDVRLCLCHSVHLFVYLTVCHSVCLFVCLSIYLSFSLSVSLWVNGNEPDHRSAPQIHSSLQVWVKWDQCVQTTGRQWPTDNQSELEEIEQTVRVHSPSLQPETFKDTEVMFVQWSGFMSLHCAGLR